MLLGHTVKCLKVRVYRGMSSTFHSGGLLIGSVYIKFKYLFNLVVLCFFSGKVAKEVMELSAKIKRDPPEIHRSNFFL